jgi:hypothetical protein
LSEEIRKGLSESIFCSPLHILDYSKNDYFNKYALKKLCLRGKLMGKVKKGVTKPS